MAILEHNTRRYTGLSTDTKPTERADVGIGSTFYEIDTGILWLFNGVLWFQKSVESTGQETQTVLLSNILETLQKISASLED